MSDKVLRGKLIKLAYANPEMRDDILPLIEDDTREALERTKSRRRAPRQSAASLGTMWKNTRSEFLKNVLPILEGRHGIVEAEGLVGKVDGDRLRISVYLGEKQDRITLWIPEVIREGGVMFVTLNSSGDALSESQKFQIDRLTPKDVADWASKALREFYGSMNARERQMWGI